MLPALAGPNGLVNITRQNNSETSGFDRGRCVLTTSCKNTALAAAWIDQMYAPLQSPQNNWGTYGEKGVWGTAALLMICVLLFNVIARIVGKQLARKMTAE